MSKIITAKNQANTYYRTFDEVPCPLGWTEKLKKRIFKKHGKNFNSYLKNRSKLRIGKILKTNSTKTFWEHFIKP